MMKIIIINIFLTLFAIIFLPITTAFSADKTINLIVAYKKVHFAGKDRLAIAVNNQIPAPTVHFKQGDHVLINVYNRLDQETAIHWHGMLVPWQMDGVKGVTQRGIPPGGVFHYAFTLNQSGTYWYHAHAGLQEQQGLYGAFLIDPPQPPSYLYSKDFVIVLSDWSNTNPEQILANLKKEGDYYSPRFPLQASLAKFLHDYNNANPSERKELITDYKTMQHMRMGLYDFSDVAYDAFLLNGQSNFTPWTARVKIGDIVRLRFIGAGGSTLFHVKIPNTRMQLIQKDGNDIQPYYVNDFMIAPGETYDVLIKIENQNPYIIYAESLDTLGAAYGALITNSEQYINYKSVQPFPEPMPVTRTMMMTMMDPPPTETDNNKIEQMSHTSTQMNMPSNMDMHADMSHMSMEPKHTEKALIIQIHHDTHSEKNITTSMNHDMSMPTEPTQHGDMISPPTDSYDTSSSTKYQHMIAAVKTNDPNKPVYKTINMELFGYMDRYIWFINGVPEYLAKPLIIKPNKRYRIIFNNNSMMHHPMHIHGHWLILRKGNNEFDPLFHTIDVAPGETITADLDTDASGQWIMHCHLLYHMTSGMSRIFQYSTLIELMNKQIEPENTIQQTNYINRPIVRVDEARPLDDAIIMHPMAHPMHPFFANFLEVGEDPFHNAQKFTFKGLYGGDYHKLELFINDAEIEKGTVDNADIDIFYWHLLNQFWALKGGTNYFYRPTYSPYWQPGIALEGLTPYFIDTDIRAYTHSGSFKLDIELSRDTQITNHFFINLGIRSIAASKTVSNAEIGSGVNQMQYTVKPFYRVMPGLNIFTEYELDDSLGVFRRQQINAGESAAQTTVTFGVEVVF